MYLPGAPDACPLLAKLARLLPPDRGDSVCLIEVAPQGFFIIYGFGIPLMAMRRPQAARARVPVEMGGDAHRAGSGTRSTTHLMTTPRPRNRLIS